MSTPFKWILDPHDCPGYLKNKIVDHLERGHLIHHTEYLFVKIPERYALVNISRLIEGVLHRAKLKDGFCFVSAMHITAGVYINDAESGLLEDISKWIEKLAPFQANYRHHQTGEDNADAHLKSYLTNPSLSLPVTSGSLDLGTWQQLFYAEFDGKREKRILVKVTGLTE